ncbi:hypothetical protein ACNFU2_06525 [Chryseobacterium sp. PTM-20240506]|uniref:hypothetical protein n=1 Tax=Chryseobacterium sp. PTM-20240506 TaxID=3400631 RepID=UPI003AB05A82
MEKKITEKKAAPLIEEQLSEKEAELKLQAETLAQEKQDFEKEKKDFQESVLSEAKKLAEGFTDLEEKEKEFNEKVEGFNSDVETLNQERIKFEAEKEEFKNHTDSTSQDIKEAIEPLKCTYDDEEYQFDVDAPELILFDGKGWKHQEIIDNEDVLLQIIGGGLGLINKI